IENVNAVDLLLMSRPHRIIVGIVSWGDLHAATAELWLGPLVADEWHDAVQERQADFSPLSGHLHQGEKRWQMRFTTPFQACEFFFQGRVFSDRSVLQLMTGLRDARCQGTSRVRMTGHCGIAQHRLRASRRHHNRGRLAWLGINNWVAQIVKMALHRLIHDLVIGHGSLQLAIPIDQTIATKNQRVLKHAEERPAHCPGADVIHGKALAVPVTRAAHRLLLADDPLLILVLPVPNALYQARAPDVVTRLTL